MSEIPSVCIRRDSATYTVTPTMYWRALCGVDRPHSSISYKHAVAIHEGRIPLTLPMCQPCDDAFRYERRTEAGGADESPNL